jgi:hypothetical protein
MVEVRKLGNKGFKQNRKPDYINPRLFAQIILGWVTNPYPGMLPKKRSSSQTQLQANIQALHLKYPQFAEALEVWLLDCVEDKTKPGEFFSTFLANLEVWFDTAMQETTRKYKQYAKKLLLAIGFLLAIYINFDPISLTYHLWNASHFQEVTTENTENSTSAEIPIGWKITDTQDGKCSLFPVDEQFFGIPFSNARCLSQSPSSNNDNLILKLAGFILGSVLISIGSQYIYDRWKDKITI